MASVDGEVGRLLPGFFGSLSRRMSRRRPSASGVSSLDEKDDAKDKLEDDDVADWGVRSMKAGIREKSCCWTSSGAGGSSEDGGAVRGRKGCNLPDEGWRTTTRGEGALSRDTGETF